MWAHRAVLNATRKEHARRQKGNALVEFALILPVFLFLLFGGSTFSVAWYDKTMLTMATREGARAGAIYVSGSSTSAERIDRARTAALSACSGKIISFGAGSPIFDASISGDNIIVTVNFNYTGVYIFSSGYPITAQTTMRLELP